MERLGSCERERFNGGAPPSHPMLRPLGVTILAAFFIVQGVVNIAVSAASGSIGPGQAYFVLTSAIGFAATYGMLRGSMWGRYTAMVLAGIGLAFGLLGTFSALDASSNPFEGFAGVLANLIVIYYLTRPEVEAYFRGGQAESLS